MSGLAHPRKSGRKASAGKGSEALPGVTRAELDRAFTAALQRRKLYKVNRWFKGALRKAEGGRRKAEGPNP